MSKPMTFKVTNCDLKETEFVRKQILAVRGHRVMLDGDLAKLYGVTTKQLNQQLRRNRHRFPKDFAFRLTLAEAKNLEGETMNISRRLFFSLLLVHPKQSVSLRVAVLETFALNGRVSAILVNHAEPAERDRLARWLQAHPRSVVRIRNKAGQETAASIFRVRMCFGRGLILFDQPIDVREGDVLTIVV
jgi:hypothetical protein